VNLREMAEADNAFLLEDATSGFGTAIELTEPNDSVAISAVIVLSVTATNGTITPANLRWKIGDYYYRQNAAVTIASGTGLVTVTAEIAGADSNQDNGTVLTVLPLVGTGTITAATVQSTTTAGVDRLPDVVYNVTGQYHRVGVDIDPETGQLIAGKKSAITVRASRFNAAKLPDEGWHVKVTDILGTIVRGRIAFAMADLTAGRITATLKRC
jgi:hypothetical protein